MNLHRPSRFEGSGPRRRRRVAVLTVLTTGVLVAGTTPAVADGYTTEFVNVNTAGQKADAKTSRFPSVSETGLIVAFDSDGTNLAGGDTNGRRDVFVRYRGVPMTIRASVSTSGAQANGDSSRPALSTFAERVAFESNASNLVSGDTNGVLDIFVRNLYSPQSTDRVSVSSKGVQGNGESAAASISDDAREVSFSSVATNLVPNDTNGVGDVFVRDVVAGTTTRVSVSSTGAQANGQSFLSSTHGSYVAFVSSASNLVPGDTNGADDVFVRDLVAGTTTRVSVSSTGAQANGNSTAPSMSPAGVMVGFASDATNLVAGDTNQARDVFVRQLPSQLTTRASVSSSGEQANGPSFSPSMGLTFGFDGIVAFVSSATNLVSGDTNRIDDVFRRDMSEPRTGRAPTERWNVATDGSQATGGTNTGQPAMVRNGQAIAFVSDAANLAPGDGFLTQDVFLRFP
ncbi:hypothetical protein ACIA5G_45685 [Amycolatopsis sp. NPDC051758]|uniref:hypothetical protein n=1 Tax=Amycolatopsis sp. NPDC051758 TaxID=3363935 RepID=UPI00379DFE01